MSEKSGIFAARNNLHTYNLVLLTYLLISNNYSNEKVFTFDAYHLDGSNVEQC